MTKLNLFRFAALVLLASLSACKTTLPPVQPAPVSAPQYVPEPIIPAPNPVPRPVYIEPDYTLLEGHSSRTTPVPVEPIDVQDIGPVFGQ